MEIFLKTNTFNNNIGFPGSIGILLLKLKTRFSELCDFLLEFVWSKVCVVYIVIWEKNVILCVRIINCSVYIIMF